MTKKWNPARPLSGYTDDETVMLDLDDTPFKTVKYWAMRAMKWFKLKGFIIFKSSKNCYHVVFDRKVCWKENVSIVAWVALQHKNVDLVKWFLMQCIKGSSTLRISHKKEKPSPRIVYRYGKQDVQIRSFLAFRRKLKRILRNIDR